MIADRGVDFKSFGDTWRDTTTLHGRQMLTMIGGLAESERELIHARTAERRARAEANGAKLGRKPKLDTAPEARGDPAARRGD